MIVLIANRQLVGRFAIDLDRGIKKAGADVAHLDEPSLLAELDLPRLWEEMRGELATALFRTQRATSGSPSAWKRRTSSLWKTMQYALEIARAITEKLTAEQDAACQQTLLANEAARKTLDLANQAD